MLLSLLVAIVGALASNEKNWIVAISSMLFISLLIYSPQFKKKWGIVYYGIISLLLLSSFFLTPFRIDNDISLLVDRDGKIAAINPPAFSFCRPYPFQKTIVFWKDWEITSAKIFKNKKVIFSIELSGNGVAHIYNKYRAIKTPDVVSSLKKELLLLQEKIEKSEELNSLEAKEEMFRLEGLGIKIETVDLVDSEFQILPPSFSITYQSPAIPKAGLFYYIAIIFLFC